MVQNTKLEERTAYAIEKIADATIAINKSVDAIFESQKQLNDSFIFHQNATERATIAMAVAQDKAAMSLANSNEKAAMTLATTNEKIADTNQKLCVALEAQGVEIKGIREDFKSTVYPMLKWFAGAIIIIAAGVEGAKLLGIV